MPDWFLAEPGVAWLAAGLLLMVMELALPGAFLLWLGLAGIGTGLLSRLIILGFDGQVVAFAVFTALSIGLALTLRRQVRQTSVNTPGSGLVGREVTSLFFEGTEGRVRLGDSDWPARLVGGSSVPGVSVLPTKLKVVAVDGMVLIVQPVT